MQAHRQINIHNRLAVCWTDICVTVGSYKSVAVKTLQLLKYDMIKRCKLMDEFRKGKDVLSYRIYSVVSLAFFGELLQAYNDLWSILYLALAHLHSSCGLHVLQSTHNTRQGPTEKEQEGRNYDWNNNRIGEVGNKNRHTCVQFTQITHRKEAGHTTTHKQTSIVKLGPRFVWAANYGPYSIFHGCGLGK